MTTNNIRYWGYRIDTRAAKFFREELERRGCLRQGWGWEGQDLREPRSLHPSAVRNLRMLEVKKGDILLVPRLPEWHLVAIVEATEDWNAGYHFEIPRNQTDFGHSFPAKLVESFSRRAPNVTGDLNKSLKCQGRFWNMDSLGHYIEVLRQNPHGQITYQDRLKGTVEGAFYKLFEKEKFGELVYNGLNEQFENARWEDVLVEVLEKTCYPPPCTVQKVSGPGEAKHGTDIRISLPKLGHGPVPVIAVQVKDWEGTVGTKKIKALREQIDKMGLEEDDHRVIERVVIMTEVSGKAGQNAALKEYGEQDGVRMVFKEELRDLLTDYGKRTMGLED